MGLGGQYLITNRRHLWWLPSPQGSRSRRLSSPRLPLRQAFWHAPLPPPPPALPTQGRGSTDELAAHRPQHRSSAHLNGLLPVDSLALLRSLQTAGPCTRRWPPLEAPSGGHAWRLIGPCPC